MFDVLVVWGLNMGLDLIFCVCVLLILFLLGFKFAGF